jgi:ribose transport system ATP-binding protein
VKAFPGVRALADISIEVSEGEIHGLVGENGAGKSTLIKILGGIYQPDAGEVRWRGETVQHASPAHAIQRGIEVIPQELSLAPGLSCAENMMIANYPSRFGRVRWRALLARAREIAARLELDVDLRKPVGELSAAHQRLVMIGRALARDARLLIMDEPTVSLAQDEVDALLGVIRELRADGVTFLYVSHRLDEIIELTDRVTVMKDAHVTATLPTSELDKRRMMELIVGRPLGEYFPHQGESVGGTPLLSVRNLGRGRVRGVSFDLFPGEVLGIAGLVGSGRTEVARMIFGADRRETGTVEFEGEPLALRTPREAIRKGMAFLPEDRRHQGGVVEMPVAANITLPSLMDFALARIAVRRRAERRTAESRIAELGIVTPSPAQLLKFLSGGNQQKTLIAKWLQTKARLFIFDEPAVGIDVGAKAEIFALIAELAAQGAGVIVISSELEEIIGLCRRVVVMREGTIVGELRGAEISEAAILQLCYAA